MTEDIHSLAALYAVGALDGSELIEFEAHLASCTDCEEELRSLVDTVGALAESGALAPPLELREAVMARIAVTPQEPVPAADPGVAPAAPYEAVIDQQPVVVAFGRSGRARAALALAAALVLVAGIGALLLRDGTTTVDELAAAPDAIETTLAGDDTDIRAIWSAERDQIALVGAGLADPGEDRVYELWFLLEDGVRRAGLFEPRDDGSLEIVLDLDDVTAAGFGVTIEPAGGVDQPTGDVLYAGEVNT